LFGKMHFERKKVTENRKGKYIEDLFRKSK